MKIISSTCLMELFKSKKRRSQELFPELIRKLIRLSINKTGEICFPSGDAIYTTGWDGYVKGNLIEHEYIPMGESYWEIGTNEQTYQKVESDYEKRKNEATIFKKKDVVYVAVSSKIWKTNKKTDFCKEKNKEGIWAAVKIIDANDLENWLEDHIDVAIWLLKEFGKDVDDYGIELLSESWAALQESTEPALSGEVIFVGNEAKAKKFKEDIAGLSTNQIYSIASPYYGREHAYMFTLAALMLEGDKAIQERCVVAKNQSALDVIKTFCTDKIVLIAFNCLDERLSRSRNTFIVFDVFSDADMELAHIELHKFSDSLKSMGFDLDKAHSISLNVNANISALKRLLAVNPLLKRPIWANEKTKSELIPLMLMGEIRFDNENDLMVLESLVGEDYDVYLDQLNYWIELDESPVLKYKDIYRINTRKECFDFISVDSYSLKVKKIEKKLLEILREENSKYRKDKSQWYINDGSYKWGERLIRNILEGFILLSLKDAKTQQHFDGYVRDILEGAKENYVLLLTIAPHFGTLAELSSTSFLRYINECVETKNEAFIKLMETETEGVMGWSYGAYITGAIDICLRFEKTSIETLRLILKLYFLGFKKTADEKIYEKVIEVFSPVSVGVIPVTLGKKMDVLYGSLEGKEEEKSKRIVEKFITNGKSTMMTPVYSSYKIPPKSALKTSYYDYFDMQNRAMNWMFEHSEKVGEILILKEVLRGIHTLSSDAFEEKMQKFINHIATKVISDEEKAELNLLVLKTIYDIKQFEDWKHEKQFLGLLDNLYELTLPQDSFIRFRYMFEIEEFPILDPEIFSFKTSSRNEHNRQKRDALLSQTLEVLIEERGENVLNQIIDVANGKVWSLWKYIYKKSRNQNDDILKFLEIGEQKGLRFYLGEYTIDQIKQIFEQLNVEQRKTFIKNLPFREDVIDFFEGQPEEYLYWEDQKVWLSDCSFFDKAYRKLLEFAPIQLLDYFAYNERAFSYEIGMEILNAVSKPDIQEKFFRSSAHDTYSLREFIENMDERFYTNELAYAEFLLLPLLIGQDGAYPQGVKRYFWDHPKAFAQFIGDIIKNRKELQEGTLGQKILFDIIMKMDKNCYIPTEYMLQKGDEIKEWVNVVRATLNNFGEDEVKLVNMALIGILAMCPHVEMETIWPTRAVADSLEEIAKDKVENSDRVAQHFSMLYGNSRGCRSVGNGEYEYQLSETYNQYSKDYEPTHPVVAKALNYISDLYRNEGERDREHMFFED